MDPFLLIVGASVRTAAFSALRAGIRPVCADLFGDQDLRACCPAERLAPGTYPRGFLDLPALDGYPGYWMYTGGLENHPEVVWGISQRRPLCGNPAEVLEQVRNPFRIASCLKNAGIPCPEVRMAGPGSTGKWLCKPLAGAGGRGISLWEGKPCLAPAAYRATGRSTLTAGLARRCILKYLALKAHCLKAHCAG